MLAACSGAASGTRPRWEVADVFQQCADDVGRSLRLSPSQRKVMHDITRCRTAYLGGHVERCDDCGFERIAYNSCRNRHCPKCQALAKAEWLEARRSELLPVDYFHVVFTMPHELNPLALCNKRALYDILFRAASETLHEFARDPQHGLGGKMGFTAILHTWDQQLRHHAHVHCVVTGGALAPDRLRWVSARKGFLFPVRALGKLFRGKFIAFLNEAFLEGTLRFPGKAAALATPDRFKEMADTLWKKPWVVYAKPPFGGPDKVLDYLGRYTHRVAIANHRIIRVAESLVSFTFRDRSDANRKKVCTLPAREFTRRFLLHVLPKGYVRIRHFGFLAARSKGRDLVRCRELLGMAPETEAPAEKTMAERILELIGVDLLACPNCKRGTMRPVMDLKPLYLLGLEKSPVQPEIRDIS